MSPVRMTVMGVVTAALIGLMGWQYYRIGRVEACLAAGMVWNGPASRCDSLSPIILERSLKRT